MPADVRVRPARLVVARRYPAEVVAIGSIIAITLGFTHGLRGALLAGGLAVAALVVTLFAHEAGHAVAAAIAGVRVHALTLRGALNASVRRDRVRPGRTAARTEVLICLAGPAVSLALLAISAAALLAGVDGSARVAAWCLLGANVIAVGGSLPGVPSTDGTRALARLAEPTRHVGSSPSSERRAAIRSERRHHGGEGEGHAPVGRVHAHLLDPRPPGRTTPRSVQLLMLRWWLVALGFKLLGSSWDVSWHFKWLRDDFAPPHMLNTVGTGIAIGLVLTHTFTGYGVERSRCGSCRSAPVFVVAGPIDVVNHRINGLDLTAWSPSHMLLYTGTAIMVVGVIRNFYLSYPRDGVFARQWAVGLVALFTFLFEDSTSRTASRSTGSSRSAHGCAAPPTPNQPAELRRPSDRPAGRRHRNPALRDADPPLGVPGLDGGGLRRCLAFARITVGRRWTATAITGLYLGYRLSSGRSWWSTFPPSSVPLWLLPIGLAVDVVFLIRLPAYVRAWSARGRHGAAALGCSWRPSSRVTVDLAGKPIADLRSSSPPASRCARRRWPGRVLVGGAGPAADLDGGDLVRRPDHRSGHAAAAGDRRHFRSRARCTGRPPRRLGRRGADAIRTG